LYLVASSETYRIKIIGFQKKLTLEILNRILNEKNCYIKRNQDRIGYIGQIKSMKYARRLMAKWHNKEIHGQKLQCQIELDPVSTRCKSISRFGSMSNLETRKNDSRRIGRSYEQLNCSTSTSRDTSISREDSDLQITTLSDQEFNNEGRLFDRSLGQIIKQRDSDTKSKARSTEYGSLPLLSKCKHMIV